MPDNERSVQKIQSRPIRIAHVVGSMNRGGVETWLMNVLRNIDREHYHFIFIVHTHDEAAYDREIAELGSEVVPCLDPRNPVLYWKRLRDVLRHHGPIDVVHSHVYFYSGWVSMIAQQCGVPVRIAHSHTARITPRTIQRRLYETLSHAMIDTFATHKIGVSSSAAKALFGKNPRSTVLYYGLDFSRISPATDRAQAKERIGLPRTRIVVGHVGRFVPEKNHAFALDILDAARRLREDVHLLLVGDGPLRSEMERRVQERGLTPWCTFAGQQSDVVPFLQSMDAFVLPSIFEGLGIVALEAQAAGVPVVLASNLPSEVEIVPGLIYWRDLREHPRAWAETLISAASAPPRSSGEIGCVGSGRFSLRPCIRTLCAIYEEGNLQEQT